ncbi:MAG: cytochrome ubiquinol oxidase subunit I [Deltaproteobacteria bacterium HGW-Deltaproteobacteria-19]|jgi:cytochrome d ubiquinol oxidase subunit I|nr:MAG: cytochrome ubiquinol oxidase subunit I [Deltaproteobacteria bacterium HGW-Deltaproteobacteria-19]
MDVLALSRLQFAATAGFHFLFVPLTLGLSILVAFMESRWVATGNPMYLRMTRFWGKLFLINFILGVVTGLTMEFQFGMNWAEYSRFVGDIFGVPLAIEATVAFFLESTFIGLWIFGWNRVSKRTHAFAMWMVAFATNLSALWILLANGWMQHPVGYVIRNGRAEMVDFWALVTNSYAWWKFFHTTLSGYVVAAFFVLGISAWHLLRKNEQPLFTASFRMAAVFGLVSSMLLIAAGDFAAKDVAKAQPTKLAAMESHWETGKTVPFYVLLVPDAKNERNAVEAIPIPGVVSFLSFGDFKAEVKGLKEFPKENRPPVMEVFVSFRTMVALGGLFVLLSAIAVFLVRKGRLDEYQWFLKILFYAIPLPYIAAQLGWTVAEVGRQPWLVYGVYRTAEGVSRNVSTEQVILSLAGFTLFYGFLGLLDIYLLAKFARKGPEPVPVKTIGPEGA